MIKMILFPVPEEAPSSRVKLVMLLSALSGNVKKRCNLPITSRHALFLSILLKKGGLR